MSISKSLEFFSSIPKIYNILKAIDSVGLGYITLGQSSTTLSGGESQRNTIIIIEHNLDVIKQVDHIIDIGPEGGKNGGKLIDSGSPREIIKNNKGYTAKYLSNEIDL